MLSAEHRAVSNGIFAITIVVILAIAAGGLLLYTGRPPMVETMTVTTTPSMSETMSHSSSGSMSGGPAPAIAFTAAHGQMFGVGWLLISPTGNGSYAVSIHATGLEPAAMGDYIVEAAQKAGQMAMVPLAGTNATQSEFVADDHGNGHFFVILHQDPHSLYESVSIVYLPGMQMTSATAVATAPLGM